MENPRTQILFFVFLLVLILYFSVAASQEVEDESHFDYIEGSGQGPERWGEIDPEWEKCNNGEKQSPIDLLNERVEIASFPRKLNRNYKPSNATLKNRGHDMMLKWVDGAGWIEINGIQYILQQCHWHSPSEHTIDGKKFDLEVHLVHESLDKKVAVVGIMYKIGRPDRFLSSLEGHLGYTNSTGEEKVVGFINPKGIKIRGRKYYRYIGSLTVPPCTEDVVWTIIRKVNTVSENQVKLLRVAVHDDADTNARPTQPINQRSIHLYNKPEDSPLD